MTPSGQQTIRGVFLGATMGSLLMLAGWTVRDRYPVNSPCRDSFRRILPDTEAVGCITPGQTMLFIELENGRPGVICSCNSAAPRRGATELL